MDRERSVDQSQQSDLLGDASSSKFEKYEFGMSSRGKDLQKIVEQCFPLDVAYYLQYPLHDQSDQNQTPSYTRNLLFRLDIQEYQHIEEGDLRSLLQHILSSEEKNCLLFTFDMTSKSSFKKYLKQALRDLIFAYEDQKESSREKQRLVPFLVVGMKRDIESKQRVSKDEVQKMVEVLKKHVQCEVIYTSAHNQEDVLATLHQVFHLADDIYFHDLNLKLKNDLIQFQQAWERSWVKIKSSIISKCSQVILKVNFIHTFQESDLNIQLTNKPIFNLYIEFCSLQIYYSQLTFPQVVMIIIEVNFLEIKQSFHLE